MNKSGLVRACLLLSMLFVVSPTFAQVDQMMPTLGGNGGGYFTTRCAPDEILNGFDLRVADDVDWIRAICVRVDSPTSIVARNLHDESAGGPGGHPVRINCPDDTPAIALLSLGWEGAQTRVINNIEIYCSIAAPYQHPADLPTVGFNGILNTVGSSVNVVPLQRAMQRCPTGLFPVGIVGRAGKWLDALGLVCGGLHLDLSALPKPAAPGKPRLTVIAGPPFEIVIDWTRPVPADFIDWYTIDLWKDQRWVTLSALMRPQDFMYSAKSEGLFDPARNQAFRVCAQNAVHRSCSPETWYYNFAKKDTALHPNASTAQASVVGANNKVAPPTLAELDALAKRGAEDSLQDPLATELRKRTAEGAVRRGFDIGIGVWLGNAAPGPGKQRVHDALSTDEQSGFDIAAAYSLPRNKYAASAGVGAAIGQADSALISARNAEDDVFYWLGFDIATGIFGNPKLGASGNTAFGPGAAAIRNELNAPGQRGFNAAMVLHLGRHYQ